MNPTRLPTAEEAALHLGPTLRIAHRLIAKADREAIAAMANFPAYSPVAHAGNLRHLLGCYFGDSPLRSRRLNTDGVEVMLRPYTIKILKAPENFTPPAGRNASRRNWWTQKSEQLEFDFPLPVASHVRLLLLWSADAEGLTSLSLALPIEPGQWPNCAKVLWYEPLLDLLARTAGIAPVQTDDDFADPGDIAFELEPPDAETGDVDGQFPW